jgi:hypothetical protein
MVKCCKADCATCRVIKLSPKWSSKCQIEGLPGVTWLATRWSKTKLLGIGCLICHEAGVATSYARVDMPQRGLKCCWLGAHGKSLAHRKAVCTLLGKGEASDPNQGITIELLQEVLDARLSGQSLAKASKQLGLSRYKFAQAQFCLAEAARFQDRQFIAQSESCALYQDASGPRMVMRYSTADSNLRVVKGLVGVCNHLKSGGGASGVADATRQIMAKFCTPYACPPPRKLCSPPAGATSANGSVDKLLLRHFRDQVRIFGTDAAADELAAARSLGKEGVDRRLKGLRPTFPNLLLNVRDFTHGARRIAKERGEGGVGRGRKRTCPGG